MALYFSEFKRDETVSGIIETIEESKKEFAAAILNGITDPAKSVDSKSLSDFSQKIAQLEGQLEAFSIADRTLARFEKPEHQGVAQEAVHAAIVERVTSKLLLGADDTWSGRGNDHLRVRFEGFREAARLVIEQFHASIEY